MEEIKEIFNTIYNQESYDKEDLDKCKDLVIESIKTFYPEYEYIIPNIDKIIKLKYVIDFDFETYNESKSEIITLENSEFNKRFITCEERDDFFDKNYYNSKIINPNSLNEYFRRLYEQYNYLFTLPQPVQKSKEWFEMRNNMITASNCGTVIGECKYATIKSLLLDKIGLGEKFKENKFVYHGKKYEKIAILIYEIIYNTKVGEFGLIQHPTIPYLGASPDGISMSLTLDGKMNPMIGRMLEIKCPPAREIINKGTIKGDICPDYYWVQVQIQLECCNLPECDFWQCNLTEPYLSEDEFFNDDTLDKTIHTDNMLYKQDEMSSTDDPKVLTSDPRIKRGAIIELYPINRSNIQKYECTEWYGTYIYPPTILMTPAEYKVWYTDTIKNLNTLYPDKMKNYKYNKVVYWKLAFSHNELITKQPKWFEKHKKTYKKFWERVLYYRNHLDHAKIDLIDHRLSNDQFLKSEEDRIISNDIFIKQNPKVVKKPDDGDIFIDSSPAKKLDEGKIFIDSSPANNKLIKKPVKSTKVTKSNDDIFLTDSPVNNKNVKEIKEPNKKVKKELVPVFKKTNNIIDDDNLDLMYVNNLKK